MRTYNTDYLKSMAQTALEQIVAGVGDNVFMSWGVRGWGCGEVTGADGKSIWPCLILKVSGLIHTGLVIVALNEASDTYEVQLRELEDERPCSEWHTDVYCEELGSLIDSLVERPVGMSDEDYKDLSDLDSFVKMLSDVLDI